MSKDNVFTLGEKMKILIEKATNIVKFASNNIKLLESGAVVDDNTKAPNLKKQNAILLEVSNLPQNYKNDKFTYIDGVWDAKDEESLTEMKNKKIAILKKELQNFIYSHYDQGTQASFTALFQQAKEQNNTEALTQIQKVWDWIQSVLDYYYSKKEAIKNATNYTEIENVTWDWQDVEETEHIELKDVIQLVNQ